MPGGQFFFGPDDVYPRQRALFDQVEAYLLKRLRALHELKKGLEGDDD